MTLRGISTVSDRRAVLRSRLHELHKSIGTIVSSNYDVSDTCNLACEGCLYFSAEKYNPNPVVASAVEWDGFFFEEARRGVTCGYFAGAEPSLVPEILRAAHKHIKHGVIHTNGIKLIKEEIRYRIHISMWGGESGSKILRGASNIHKALNNYSGDKRAVVAYTISKQNIEDILPVSRMCAEHGIPITFNYFSPTINYIKQLSSSSAVVNDYFKISSADNNMMLDDQDFVRAHEYIRQALELYPDSVWYSLAYNKWVTRPGGIYTIGEDGIALDCGSRNSQGYRHYNTDLSVNSGKCCLPNLDCRECRAYDTSYATFLGRLRMFSKTDAGFSMWLDVWELWIKLFLLPENIEING